MDSVDSVELAIDDPEMQEQYKLQLSPSSAWRAQNGKLFLIYV